MVASSMSRTVGILQSNYIPWKGYFDLIHMADEFILFDDAQYTRNDWRNRNRIKTAHGVKWLTIPALIRGRFGQKICETEISDARWGEKHWKSLCQNYSRAPHFARYRDVFEPLYLENLEVLLSKVNYAFIRAVCGILGIRTRFTWSTDYPLLEGKTERLVDLCRQVGANRYVSGPAAREYMEEERFREAGYELEYISYEGYPEYPQLFPPFEHTVSILDLLFNCGPDAPRYLKTF